MEGVQEDRREGCSEILEGSEEKCTSKYQEILIESSLVSSHLAHRDGSSLVLTIFFSRCADGRVAGGSGADEDDGAEDVENDEAEVTTAAAKVEGSVTGVVSTSMASLGDEMSGGGGVRCSSSLSSIMMQQQSRSNEFI